MNTGGTPDARRSRWVSHGSTPIREYPTSTRHRMEGPHGSYRDLEESGRGQAILPGMGVSSAPSSCTRSNRIVTGRNNCTGPISSGNLVRSYWLSGPVSAERYRMSVRIDPHGAAGTYLRVHVRVSDALEVSSPRGSFVLQSGENSVVLLSAGIGARSVMDAAHAGGGPLQAAGLMAVRGSRPAASSIRRRSPPPDALAHQPADDANSGPLVSFARSGIDAHWMGSAYQSILELAEACDVPVRWSCRTGVCHSCESGLVSGAVAYKPEPLDPPADGNLLVCCSQPIRDVVIDL